ncbi:ABC transporter ATP-binding protein [Anaerovibrio sp.]|uniref:ABC transporter ATP-binding protein n=1 Tax=Anaerovibrio sp. TaxID=1872532 RepID=UPI003F181084
MLLEVKNLDISYGDNPVPTVRDVSFSLNKGEVLAIVGESGSGKTTVIRAILGVLAGSGHVSRGSIELENENLLQLDNTGWLKLRGRNISMIFQDSGNMLNPVQTIGHQYVEYIRTHADVTKQEARQMALDVLKRMNLPNPENIMASYTFELSGGMRQRVGIAMAITFHPKLLLADEPTSALDVTTQAQIVKELMSIIHQSDAAMIVVTHNIGVAAHMSDKLMVMAQGEVKDYGPTEDVIGSPKDEYTRRLLGAVPEIGGKRYV